MKMHLIYFLAVYFVTNCMATCYASTIRNRFTLTQNRQLKIKFSSVNHDACNYPIRSLEINWDKIQIFCQHFYDEKDYYYADSYFQTTYGKNFKHCRASSQGNASNMCFESPRDTNAWQYLKYDDSTNMFTTFFRKDPIHCYYRKTLPRSENDIKVWYSKQGSCQYPVPVGFLYMPKEVKVHDKLSDSKSQLLATCTKSTLAKNEINWANIDIVCFHYKTHYHASVTEIYFQATKNRGKFRFCHSQRFGDGEYCFPGPWDDSLWKDWAFENGRVHGERSYGFFTVNNVVCYTKKKSNIIGSLNDMINWYRQNERGCDQFATAGFHDFDRGKVNAPN